MEQRRMIRIEHVTTSVEYMAVISVWQRVLLWAFLPISLPIGVLMGLVYGFSLREVAEELESVYLAR